jgi:hypothetical protein
VDQIKPEACRARVEKLFASRVMAENYLRLFKEVLNGEEW